MKKILSILFSLVVALLNNIGYQQQNYVPYDADSYYKIESDEEIDYREVYGEGPTSAGNDSCHNAFFNAARPIRVLRSDGQTSAYWIEENKSVKLGSISSNKVKYTVEKDVNLVAPVRCKILSSSATPSKTNDITLECLVDGDTYTIKCKNLERWWCCYGRISASEVKNGIPIWKHTCTESMGRIINAGQVIGRALGGKTTITITKSDSDKAIPIAEFYQKAN